MTNTEFKEIRKYLKAAKYQGEKWTLDFCAGELLHGTSTLSAWESGKSPIPELIANRMRKLRNDAEQTQHTIEEDLIFLIGSKDLPDHVRRKLEHIKSRFLHQQECYLALLHS